MEHHGGVIDRFTRQLPDSDPAETREWLVSFLVGLTRCTIRSTDCTPPDGHRLARQTYRPESKAASGLDGHLGQISVIFYSAGRRFESCRGYRKHSRSDHEVEVGEIRFGHRLPEPLKRPRPSHRDAPVVEIPAVASRRPHRSRRGGHSLLLKPVGGLDGGT